MRNLVGHAEERANHDGGKGQSGDHQNNAAECIADSTRHQTNGQKNEEENLWHKLAFTLQNNQGRQSDKVRYPRRLRRKFVKFVMIAVIACSRSGFIGVIYYRNFNLLI